LITCLDLISLASPALAFKEGYQEYLWFFLALRVEEKGLWEWCWEKLQLGREDVDVILS